MTTTTPVPAAGAAPGERPGAPGQAVPAEPTRPPEPTRARPALVGLLAGTALLYLWGLGASGWANSFYSAAVQAGSVSWKAFFYGSSDAASSITVDKTPASIWVMALSARVFGVNSWSILVPQALMGVGSVWLLHATVRRWFGPAPALIAGGGARPDPGRRADVPVQQPGRPAGAAADRLRLRHRARGGDREHPLAGARRGVRRLRLPHQDAAGAAGRSGARRWSTWWPQPTPLRRRIGQLLLAGAAAAGRRRAGGWRSSNWSRRRPGRTSADRSTTA